MQTKIYLTVIASIFSVGLLIIPYTAFAKTLEDALRAALSNSLSLSASRNNWAAARENIDGAQSTKEWRTTGTLSGTQSMTNAATATRDGFLSSQSGSATVTLSRNLYDGGQRDENLLFRQLQRDIAEARYLGAEQRVILATVEAYLDVIRASREVTLNEANVARLSEHVASARARVDAGASTSTKLAQAEARLSRARTTLISAVSDHNSAEDAFLTLTAVAATELEENPDIGFIPETLLEADNLARREHPDARLATLSVTAAGQEFKALLASLRPTVALRLRANESMAEGNRSDKTEFSANVTLSTPLMPTGSVRAKARSLSSSLEATKMERLDTLRRISLDVRNRFRQLEAARAQETAVEDELAASRLVAEGISTEFQFGQKTTLDVLDAEQDVSDAELRFVNARHAILIAGFRLQAAMGQLTAGAMGMDDELGPLDNMPVRDVKYKSYLPLDVDWDAYNDQQDAFEVAAQIEEPVVVEDSSAAPVIMPEPEVLQPVVKAEIAQIVLERPVTTLNVNTPETLAITVGTLRLEPVSMDINEGVVWQIQTRDLP